MAKSCATLICLLIATISARVLQAQPLAPIPKQPTFGWTFTGDGFRWAGVEFNYACQSLRFRDGTQVPRKLKAVAIHVLPADPKTKTARSAYANYARLDFDHLKGNPPREDDPIVDEAILYFVASNGETTKHTLPAQLACEFVVARYGDGDPSIPLQPQLLMPLIAFLEGKDPTIREEFAAWHAASRKAVEEDRDIDTRIADASPVPKRKAKTRPLVGIQARSHGAERIPSGSGDDSVKGAFVLRRSDDSTKAVLIAVRPVGSVELGVAKPGSDYLLPKEWPIPEDAREAPLHVRTLNDPIVEGDEAVTVEIVPSDEYDIDPDHSQATITIFDNDFWQSMDYPPVDE